MRVAALILLALLSGCFHGAGCSERAPWTITWKQAGLYEAMPNATSHGGFSIYVTPPDPRLPFSNATLEAQWGTFGLRALQWRPPESLAGAPDTFFALEAPGRLVAVVDHALGEARIRDLFDAWARNVTAANATRRASLADDFMGAARFPPPSNHTQATNATSGDPRVHDMTVPGPFRLEALFAQATLGHTEPVPTTLSTGPWTWTFQLPTRSASRLQPGEVTFLTISGDGQATFSITSTATRRPDDLDGRLRATFEALGLPAPQTGGAPFEGQRVCAD